MMRVLVLDSRPGSEWSRQIFPDLNPAELPMAGKPWVLHVADLSHHLEAKRLTFVDSAFSPDMQVRLGNGSYWSLKLDCTQTAGRSFSEMLAGEREGMTEDDKLLVIRGRILPDVPKPHIIFNILRPVRQFRQLAGHIPAFPQKVADTAPDQFAEIGAKMGKGGIIPESVIDTVLEADHGVLLQFVAFIRRQTFEDADIADDRLVSAEKFHPRIFIMRGQLVQQCCPGGREVHCFSSFPQVIYHESGSFSNLGSVWGGRNRDIRGHIVFSLEARAGFEPADGRSPRVHADCTAVPIFSQSGKSRGGFTGSETPYPALNFRPNRVYYVEISASISIFFFRKTPE